jgi:hypothetical protein
VISSTARQIHFCVRPTARVIGYAVAVLSSMTQASSLPELPVLKFLTFGIALAKPLTWCSEDAVARSGRLIVFFKEGENVASCLGAYNLCADHENTADMAPVARLGDKRGVHGTCAA